MVVAQHSTADGQGLVLRFERLVKFALLLQQHTEVVVREAELWIDRQRLLVRRQRIGFLVSVVVPDPD